MLDAIIIIIIVIVLILNASVQRMLGTQYALAEEKD